MLARLLRSSTPLVSSADENQAVQHECMYLRISWESNVTTTNISSDALKRAETLSRIQTARQRVRSEILDLNERLRITRENIKRIRKRPVDSIYPVGTFTAVTRENSVHEDAD
jgi:hypothetical protein